MRATPKTEDTPHPPLARDASGNLLPVPEGTAAWRLCRQTRGRPRTVNGPDGEPYRFPLELDAQALEDMCGAGTYRVYALDEVGNVLDYVTTVRVGVDGADGDPTSMAVVRNANTVPATSTATSTDLRFALETIGLMSRSYAESLRAVTEAQADWVKAIALAKGLPRNVPFTARQLTSGDRDDEDDVRRRNADSDGDDDDESDDERAAPRSGMDALLMQFAPLVPELMSIWRSMMLNHADATARPDAKPAIASGPDPMVHLARILAGLSRRERTILQELLGDHAGSKIAHELNRRSVVDAIAFVRGNIDAADEAERGQPAGQDRKRVADDANHAAPAEPAAVDSETMGKLIAALKQLGPAERARLITLRPRILADAALVAELQAVFRPMSGAEVAGWVRENLDQLEARFSS